MSSQLSGQQVSVDSQKNIGRLIDLSMIVIKQKAMGVKVQLISSEERQTSSLSSQIRNEGEALFKKNSHIVYPFASENDVDMLRYLLLRLYETFTSYESKESIFQQFRQHVDSPLRSVLQDKIVLERKLSEKSKLVQQTTKDMVLLQQKIEELERKFNRTQFSLYKIERVEEKTQHVRSEAINSKRIASELHQNLINERQVHVSEEDMLRNKIEFLLKERAVIDLTTTSLKKANQEIHHALSRANLRNKEILARLREAEKNNKNFLEQGTDILNTLSNIHAVQFSPTEKELHGQLFFSFTPERFSPTRSLPVQREVAEFHTSAIKSSSKLAVTESSSATADESVNYENEFLKLCEFNLSLITSIEGSPIHNSFLLSTLKAMKTELQAKKIELQTKSILTKTPLKYQHLFHQSDEQQFSSETNM